MKKTNLRNDKLREQSIVGPRRPVVQKAKPSVNLSSADVVLVRSKTVEEKPDLKEKAVKHDKGPVVDSDAGEDYADDFESYESDFEDYSGDSANSTDIDDQTISVFEASQHYSQMGIKEQGPIPEEFRTREIQKPNLEETHPTFSIEKLNVYQRVAKRSAALLGMIRLDLMTFELFSMPPCDHPSSSVRDGFRTKAVQACPDKLQKELQTETIHSGSAWTQHPTLFPVSKENLQSIQKEIRGSGFVLPEDDHRTAKSSSRPTVQTLGISTAAKFIENILNEKDELRRESQHLDYKVPYSSSHKSIRLNHCKAVENTNTVFVEPSQDGSQLAVVHTLSQTINARHFISVWEVKRPWKPAKLLVCESQLSCLNFWGTKPRYVIGGCTDGLVCLWDLKLTSENIFLPPCVLLGSSLNKQGHTDPIVYVGSRPKGNNNLEFTSVDSGGKLIVWSLGSSTKTEKYEKLPGFFCDNIDVKVSKSMLLLELGLEERVTAVDISGKLVVFGTNGGAIYRKSLEEELKPQRLVSCPRRTAIRSLQISRKGERILASQVLGLVSVLDMNGVLLRHRQFETGGSLRTFEITEDIVLVCTESRIFDWSQDLEFSVDGSCTEVLSDGSAVLHGQTACLLVLARGDCILLHSLDGLSK